MAPIEILKFPISSPGDISPLRGLREAGFDPSQIIAVVGKTEGNGCVNDFSRTLASTVWESQIPSDAVTIFSGGTEGVLSPHVTFFLRSRGESETGLSAIVGHTRDFEPHEIGTDEQARQVAATVKSLVGQLDAISEQVHMVLIKCPLLTSDKLQTIRDQSRVPVTTDTYESMAKSRYASAVGIAAALGEIEESQVPGAVAENNVWSAKASCSSGAELENCHILVLASTPSPKARLHAVSRPMSDAIDASSIMALLKTAQEAGGKVVQVFAKAEADPSGNIRTCRHTMNTDSDIHSTRHARAAVGGLLAGVSSDTQIYVSGGAEGQGPVGGGSLCVVYRT